MGVREQLKVGKGHLRQPQYKKPMENRPKAVQPLLVVALCAKTGSNGQTKGSNWTSSTVCRCTNNKKLDSSMQGSKSTQTVHVLTQKRTHKKCTFAYKKCLQKQKPGQFLCDHACRKFWNEHRPRRPLYYQVLQLRTNDHGHHSFH